jgi:hypothetical protein
MTRKEKYIRRYGRHADAILASIASVGGAGRSKDPSKIAAARARHHALKARANVARTAVPD